jgi:hypothetical protein
MARPRKPDRSAQEQSEREKFPRGRATFTQLLTTLVSFTIGMLIISDVSAYCQFNEPIDSTDVIFSALVATAFTIGYSRYLTT